MNSIIVGIHNEFDDTFSSKLINKGKELKEDSKTNSSRKKRKSVCVKSAKLLEQANRKSIFNG